jgi:heat shock protein HslJ
MAQAAVVAPEQDLAMPFRAFITATLSGFVFLTAAGMLPEAGADAVPREQRQMSQTSFRALTADGSTWVVESIDGARVEGPRPFLRFGDGGRASGFAGCNTFVMPFAVVSDDRLRAGALGLTRKLCRGEANAVEQRFAAAMASAGAYRIEGDTIIIDTAEGEVRLVRRAG